MYVGPYTRDTAPRQRLYRFGSGHKPELRPAVVMRITGLGVVLANDKDEEKHKI
jgi:hypothetical protein